MSNLTIVILPLPIYYYLLNLFLKVIGKDKITFEDLYLYNNYLIEKLNLYNIIYLSCITIMIKYFYEAYVYISIGFFVLFLCYFLHKINIIGNDTPNSQQPLQSSCMAPCAYTIPFIALSPYFKEALSDGLSEVMENGATHRNRLPRDVYSFGPSNNITYTSICKFDSSLREIPAPTEEKRIARIRFTRSPIIAMAQKIRCSTILKETDII